MLTRLPLTLILLSAAAVAGAQPAAQPASPSLGGPVVPGVCLLSREAIFANAAVGKAASARLQELTRAAQGKIDAERVPLETEAKALAAQPDTAQTKPRRDALATKWQALQIKAAQNGREMEATRAKAMEHIANDAQPVIAQVYGVRKCGLLLDRGVVMGGNVANDLTAEVVRGLDAKIQTIRFDRERLPQEQPASTTPARR